MNRSPALRKFLLATIALALGLVFTAGKKRDPFYIGFHLEGDENESKFVMQDPETEIFFRKSPEIMHHQMSAFVPFPANDGSGTYGAVFKLNAAGQQRLFALVNTNQGKLLRAVVNGVPTDMVAIDSSAPTDSIVIWRGLTENDFKLFSKKLVRQDMAGL
jgi:hypothetical protein